MLNDFSIKIVPANFHTSTAHYTALRIILKLIKNQPHRIIQHSYIIQELMQSAMSLNNEAFNLVATRLCKEIIRYIHKHQMFETYLPDVASVYECVPFSLYDSWSSPGILKSNEHQVRETAGRYAQQVMVSQFTRENYHNLRQNSLIDQAMLTDEHPDTNMLQRLIEKVADLPKTTLSDHPIPSIT